MRREPCPRPGPLLEKRLWIGYDLLIITKVFSILHEKYHFVLLHNAGETAQDGAVERPPQPSGSAAGGPAGIYPVLGRDPGEGTARFAEKWRNYAVCDGLRQKGAEVLCFWGARVGALGRQGGGGREQREGFLWNIGNSVSFFYQLCRVHKNQPAKNFDNSLRKY